MKVVRKKKLKGIEAVPNGRPVSGEYQVFTLKQAKVTIGYITVYDNGVRTFEFDNDKRYTHEELTLISYLGRSLDSHTTKRIRI